MANKILIIALEFPPIRASNDRTYHFCRYLPDFGWLPVVISPRTPSPRMLHDYSLPIPSTVQVYDARAYQNLFIAACYHNLRLLPDSNLFSVTSYLSGRRILQERGNEVSCIYASTPSSSALFSAYFLFRKFKKPLILDFRDPFYPPLIYRRLFRTILQSATKIITTTTVYQNILISQGAEVGKISIIPNGTDLEMIDSVRQKGAARARHFTVVYAGVLIPLYRIKALLKAVECLKDLDIRVVIVGWIEHDTEGLLSFAKENSLKNVEFRGRLSQEDTLKELLRATVAYNGSAHPGGIGGKVYDYLACGLPMIGYNPSESATAAFIKQYGIGLTSENEDDLAINIKYFYDNPQLVQDMRKKAESTAALFDRKYLAKELDNVLRRIPIMNTEGKIWSMKS
jgi:glycosyltransferase involved in cell wall biosynthesis